MRRRFLRPLSTKFLSRGRETPESTDPPTIVGFASQNSGPSGTPSSLTCVLPAGITNGDVGYAVVGYNGSSPSITLESENGVWTLVDGPYEISTTHTGWLYRKVLGAAFPDENLDITWPAQRGSVTVAVIRNLDLDHEVFVHTTDLGSATDITVPAITPETDNNLLINLTAIRYGTSTGPSVEPSTGWTERRDHQEGRTALVNYGGHAQTKRLTGGGGVSHGATVATKSVAGSDHSWVIAVAPPAPPPVTAFQGWGISLRSLG